MHLTSRVCHQQSLTVRAEEGVQMLKQQQCMLAESLSGKLSNHSVLVVFAADARDSVAINVDMHAFFGWRCCLPFFEQEAIFL